MLHPSYSDLMAVVNADAEDAEHPVINSRYSIVLATAKRARQIVSGDEPMVSGVSRDGLPKKALSIAVEELLNGDVKILSEDTDPE
ncbi:MAG: DNA-directed RNA polymerase subunit omega [Lachnospiraceae bacterium]|nr:DNA-directed RNA polymerase subunit omega [Lachnospiraceae bacterium]